MGGALKQIRAYKDDKAELKCKLQRLVREEKLRAEVRRKRSDTVPVCARLQGTRCPRRDRCWTLGCDLGDNGSVTRTIGKPWDCLAGH